MNFYFVIPKRAYIQNLVENGLVVFEKSKFLFSYVNDLGPRSRNNIDLEYSYISNHCDGVMEDSWPKGLSPSILKKM